MTAVPDGFGYGEEPFTDEDGVGDNVDRPLPEVDPDDYIDTAETPQ